MTSDPDVTFDPVNKGLIGLQLSKLKSNIWFQRYGKFFDFVINDVNLRIYHFLNLKMTNQL